MFSKASVSILISSILTSYPKITETKLSSILLTYTHPHLFKMKKSISNRRINRLVHPHSSKRQQARYARQLATGQLSFADGSHNGPAKPA